MDNVLENAFNHYLSYPEDNSNNINSDNVDMTDINEKDFKNCFTEEVFKYSAKKNSIPEIVLKKESHKLAYY